MLIEGEILTTAKGTLCVFKRDVLDFYANAPDGRKITSDVVGIGGAFMDEMRKMVDQGKPIEDFFVSFSVDAAVLLESVIALRDPASSSVRVASSAVEGDRFSFRVLNATKIPGVFIRSQLGAVVEGPHALAFVGTNHVPQEALARMQRPGQRFPL